MPEARRNETIDWNKKRALLEAFAHKNQQQDVLANHLNTILSQNSSSRSRLIEPVNTHNHHSQCAVKGFSSLGVSDAEILHLAQSFPGDWLESLTYINHSAPHPLAHGSASGVVVTSKQGSNGGWEVSIYDPAQDPETLCSILPASLVFAFAGNIAWDLLPQDLLFKLERDFQDLPAGVFQSTYINSLRNPGRHHAIATTDLNRDLFTSFIKTAYDSPFASDNQDWQDALIDSLRGMQHLNQVEASKIAESLAELFYFLDPKADMNSLIRSFQTKAGQIEIKITANHLARLFDQLHDRGWQAFFRRWMADSRRVGAAAYKQASALPHLDRVPGPRVAMAIDSARELDADLTKSLRLARASKSTKNNALNDLRCSLRRFNDIWKDLDKREKQYARPRLMQIIHVSNPQII